MSELGGRPTDGLDKAAIDGGRTGGGRWEIAWSTHVGSMHVGRGQLREDAASIYVGEGYAVVAVSDGHGMARSFRAHVGSELAVQAALEEATAAADRWVGSARSTSDAAQWLRESYTPAVLARWRELVDLDVAVHPLTGPEAAIAPTDAERLVAYGATLLVALVEQDRVLAWQLGDGDLLIAAGAGTAGHAVADDPHLVGNRTTSLCQPDAQHHVRTAVHELGPERTVVVLSTDGFANAMLAGDWIEQLGEDLHALVEDSGFEAVARKLPEWSAEAARASGDDVSIVVLSAAPAVASVPSAGGAPSHGGAPPPVGATAPLAPAGLGRPGVSTEPAPALGAATADQRGHELERTGTVVPGDRVRPGGRRRGAALAAVLLLVAVGVLAGLLRLSGGSSSTPSGSVSTATSSQATLTSPVTRSADSGLPRGTAPGIQPSGTGTETAGFTRRS